IHVMSCPMLNHEGFSKRTGSCPTEPGSQVVEMVKSMEKLQSSCLLLHYD
ncbi:Os06g0334100, partial [Oryza sativa Japonica Group]